MLCIGVVNEGTTLSPTLTPSRDLWPVIFQGTGVDSSLGNTTYVAWMHHVVQQFSRGPQSERS
jgi:hypothetical protein